MTDGPFRNAELRSCWKQYGQMLVSDATSVLERSMQACHSMTEDIDIPTFSPLYNELKAHVQRAQMGLDPLAEIEAIFDTHPVSRIADALQRHLAANLRDQMPSEQALAQALESTAKEWIGITKNRLDEQCIGARDRGDMNQEDYAKGIERNYETFAAIKPGELCDAWATGNARAFKQMGKKKTGLDEGPDSEQ